MKVYERGWGSELHLTKNEASALRKILISVDDAVSPLQGDPQDIVSLDAGEKIALADMRMAITG